MEYYILSVGDNLYAKYTYEDILELLTELDLGYNNKLDLKTVGKYTHQGLYTLKYLVTKKTCAVWDNKNNDIINNDEELLIPMQDDEQESMSNEWADESNIHFVEYTFDNNQKYTAILFS